MRIPSGEKAHRHRYLRSQAGCGRTRGGVISLVEGACPALSTRFVYSGAASCPWRWIQKWIRSTEQVCKLDARDRITAFAPFPRNRRYRGSFCSAERKQAERKRCRLAELALQRPSKMPPLPTRMASRLRKRAAATRAEGHGGRAVVRPGPTTRAGPGAARLRPKRRLPRRTWVWTGPLH